MEIIKFSFKEEDKLRPKSLYALTKKFNEELAKTYFDNYNLNLSVLDFSQ